VTLLLCLIKHQTAVVARILKLGIILNRVISYIPLLLYPNRRVHGIHKTGGWGRPTAGMERVERRIITCTFRKSKPIP